MPPERRLLADVKAIAARPNVITVDDHFAGYFNELGISVRMSVDASDEDIINLRNDLLVFLRSATAERVLTFTWQVSFWRGPVQASLLFPDDDQTALGDPLPYS